jgi:hypothetical protein
MRKTSEAVSMSLVSFDRAGNLSLYRYVVKSLNLIYLGTGRPNEFWYKKQGRILIQVPVYQFYKTSLPYSHNGCIRYLPVFTVVGTGTSFIKPVYPTAVMVVYGTYLW